MENKDRKILKQNVVSMSRNNKKDIEICSGAGEVGINVFKVAKWKPKCKRYFNRYFKTSTFIAGPSDSDRIMMTLSSVCSDSKSRGFIFKNYNIREHMKLLGYKVSRLGAAPTSENISYIAYIEQKNVIFICEKVLNGFSIHQCSKNLVVMVKYFLILYNREIQASGVKVIGLLIRENEKHKELLECGFCNLFSPSYKDFESLDTFKVFWNTIENYEDWWNFAKCKVQNKLFNDLAAEVLYFMALQKTGLPKVTDDTSQQFRETYYLFTPQQVKIHFSNAKHVVIQGAYGSGKSLLGLKKLELILKNHRQDKIVYINFDSKSKLHYVMEKNVKDYIKISSRKIKRINGIQNISDAPDRLIYLCCNSGGQNLSAILQDTVSLKMCKPEAAKTNYHLIIEEYDGETLSHDEAAKITKLVREGGLMESNIILLAQPLTKSRSLSIGEENYKRETGMFEELKDVFKIVKLEEVLRCSNKIRGITNSTQNFLQNKESVFKIKMDNPTFEQRQQPEDIEKHTVSDSARKYLEVGTPANSDEKLLAFKKTSMDLDQAFKKSATLQNVNPAANKIVSKFGFLCEPTQGVDIEGAKPNLFEMSVFKMKMDDLTFEQRQQPEDIERHTVSHSAPKSNYLEVGTSSNAETSTSEIRKADEKLLAFQRTSMDLDRAFKKSATLQNINDAEDKIVSKFDFSCEPRQGVDIEGIKPSLFELSEDIDLTSEMVVVSLALVLKKSIDINETITVLYMADEQPKILRRTIQLFRKLDERFSYTEDIEKYLQKKKSSRMIFSSNFRSVNGMEFDHVVIVVSQSEYYLKYFLPQVISRCTYDLTFVLLPKDEMDNEEVFLQEPSAVSSRIRDEEPKETVANLIEELKGESLVKPVIVAECKACEKSCDSSISNETDNGATFIVHTHSDQYKEHLSLLADHAELEEQAHGTFDSALAVAT